MTRVTVHDMVEAQVLGFRKGLKKWMHPLLKISYRILVDDEPDYIYLVHEGDEKKMRFNRAYIDTLTRVFRDCDWSLASPNREHKEEVYRDLSVLVITIDKKHYVILAPYKQKKTTRGMIMSYMEPREPTCQRCGAYADEDDIKYCECGAELDTSEMENKSIVICPECGQRVTYDTIRWRCPHCGFDGKPQHCVVCNALLNPKETCMCERCKLEENKAVFEDTWSTAFDEYYKDMYESEGGNKND